MKIHFALLFLMLTSMALAQESTPTPFATILPGQWKTSEVPWDDWFKKNTLVTDKGDYVHFFWNAQDARANFEGKERKNRLADSALEMAVKLQPATATADYVQGRHRFCFGKGFLRYAQVGQSPEGCPLRVFPGCGIKKNEKIWFLDGSGNEKNLQGLSIFLINASFF